MVDQIERIGKLLELPGLEDETRRTINKTIRDMLQNFVVHDNTIISSAKDEVSPQQELNPFELAQQQAKAMLGGDVYNEWVHGQKDGE